jgi:hypothetical protein
MSEPYLEQLETVLKEGCKDLHEASEKIFLRYGLKLPFEALCLTFNNGLLKGYWKIEVSK